MRQLGIRILDIARILLLRIQFWVRLPFVRAAFYMRERRRELARYPRVWLSPMQIVDRDLDLVGDDESIKLDRELLTLLIERRDSIKEYSNRLSLISVTIFGFLLLNYFRFTSDISIAGVSIKNSPGIAEILIVTSSTLGVYATALQANVVIVEGGIMHLAKRVYPSGLINILRAGFIPEQNFGKYYPKNLPHLTFTSLHSKLSLLSTYVYLLSLLFVIILVLVANLAILMDIWTTSSIGAYSKIVSLYVLAISFVGFSILIITRMPMPLRDYSLLHEIEITRQIRPKKVDELLHKIYRSTNEDRENLRRLGFLKKYDGK